MATTISAPAIGSLFESHLRIRIPFPAGNRRNRQRCGTIWLKIVADLTNVLSNVGHLMH
jgi:hypothetical protein